MRQIRELLRLKHTGQMSDRLFVKSVAKRGCREPDWSAIHRELKRPGVTQRLLWE